MSYYPCLCLCFTFSQITRIFPLLLIVLHLLQIFLIDALTFIRIANMIYIKVLFSVDNASLCCVVHTDFYVYLITRQNTNSVVSHFSSHFCFYFNIELRDLNEISSGSEILNHFTGHNEARFFNHSALHL